MLNSKKYVHPVCSIVIRVVTERTTSAYLISIAVANKVKSKFYDDDLPALENVSLLSAIVALSERLIPARCQEFRELWLPQPRSHTRSPDAIQRTCRRVY